MRFLIRSEQVDLLIKYLVITGWTDHDNAMTQHHIDELGALGVVPPSTKQLFYQFKKLCYRKRERSKS